MPSSTLTTSKRTPVRVQIRDKKTFATAMNDDKLFTTNVAVVTTSADLTTLLRTLNATSRPFAVSILTPKE